MIKEKKMLSTCSYRANPQNSSFSFCVWPSSSSVLRADVQNHGGCHSALPSCRCPSQAFR